MRHNTIVIGKHYSDRRGNVRLVVDIQFLVNDEASGINDHDIITYKLVQRKEGNGGAKNEVGFINKMNRRNFAQWAREEVNSKIDHAPIDALCEKCGKRYCDHENKY
jgi:hypothetical protein